MSDNFWTDLKGPPNAPKSGIITEALLRDVVERHRVTEIDRITRETDAFVAFLDAVPERFREHSEIRGIASIVAWSQTQPMHPRDKDALQKRYDEIVNGGDA